MIKNRTGILALLTARGSLAMNSEGSSYRPVGVTSVVLSAPDILGGPPINR